ncbi:MAG: T9SS type A sorting domain-containing protein [Bacteroidetes bacterium]|jgi:photosystem II stability/assembly factor-like uncharacterized protein|nr:T9SS type A sorting domain-containing protein [Bacteroidota bacterium]MBT7092138.1 T9SS type A sorting domain-containing protein [Bacteroidota bacterium]MBT7463621.1 T9SS type A sorting domain-containing protein [Bacteroidota bacterium]
MKNKHLLFAVTLVLAAGLTGFSQTDRGGQIELTGDSGQKVLSLDPQNPDNYVMARRVNQYTGTINVADLVRAQAQVRELNKKGMNSFGMTWDELGPNNVGGRTRALLIDKDDSNVLIAGSAGGGVWKTTTRGTSWTQSVTTNGELFENQVVSCITQAANGDIYFGTGEGFAQANGEPDNQYFGVAGQGIYKSTDRGNTFTRLESTWNNAASQEAFVWVNAIASDPNDANKLYAATRKGLRISTDGGANWINPIEGLDSVAQDVAVGSDGTVIASVYNIAYLSPSGAPGTFVKKSEVNGVSLGLINETADLRRLKFAFAPSDPNYIYCVAAGRGTNGSIDNIYQSIDKGETWSVIGPGGSSSFNPVSSVGDYNLALAVDPSNPKFIMMGGGNMWTWSYATGWERITLDEPTILRRQGFYVHINQHVIAWNQTNTDEVYVGTNGGITTTSNKGVTWNDLNRNYNVTQFLSVAFSNKGEVLGGSLDNGILYIDFQGNDPMYANWWGGNVFSSFLGFRHGGEVEMSMLDPNIKFFTTPGGTLHRRVITEGQVTTRQNFYPYANGGAFITPIAIWESWNDPMSWDSINFIADRDYAAGETLVVESGIGARPLLKVLDEALAIGDTVKIQDTYQGMMAIGKNDKASIKVNRKALSMRSDLQVWHTVINRTLFDDRSGTGNDDKIIELEFSSDGNHLFAAAWMNDDQIYKIFRISNLENARSRSTMNTLTGFDPTTGERTYVQTSTEIGKFEQIPTSITVDPTNANNVIVTTGNYGNDSFVYLSTNATEAADSTMAFTSIQSNLPQAPAYTAMFNDRDHKEVIIGTEYGVYSTTDVFAGTPTWSSENGNGMQILPVMELDQQHLENNVERGVENHGTIYAATFGRGLWKSESFSTKGATSTALAVNQLSTIEVNIMPNPVEDYAQLTYKLDESSDVEFHVFDISGKMVKHVVLDDQTAGQHQTNFDVNKMQAGTYMIRMTADGQQTTTKFLVK